MFFSFSARAEKCDYQYNKNSSILEWTAFKTNQRKGVKGTFKNITVKAKSAATISELIKGLTFSIDTFSVNSGDPARDKTLLEFFFKKAIKDGKINGSVKKITDKEIEVKFLVDGKVIMVPFTYTLDPKLKFTAKAETDMLSFGWKDAHKSLHEACKEQHKGEDGESKTWTDITLNVSTVFEKVCH